MALQKPFIALEIWFMLVLGVLIILELIPFVLFSKEVFFYHGHDAALGQFALLIFGLFFLLTSCCFAWEWLLLKMRRQNPLASYTLPVSVFCAGFFPGLLIIGLWLSTI